MTGTIKGASDAVADHLSDQAERTRDAADQARETFDDATEKAQSKARGIGQAATEHVNDLKAAAGSTADDLKQKAAAHVGEAKTLVSNMASEARSRIADIVDHQKSIGAEKLSNLSQVANSAAGELNEKNPQVARLIRDAAATADRFAGDLGDASLGDIVSSVTELARKQPVAFFAGSVLAGFVLARFLKSEPATARDRLTSAV